MLQHALRTGLRRRFYASLPVLRTMNTATESVVPVRVDTIPSSDRGRVLIRNDSGPRSAENEAELPVERRCSLLVFVQLNLYLTQVLRSVARIPFTPPETTSLRQPNRTRSRFASRPGAVNRDFVDASKSQLRLRSPRNDLRRALLVSTSVDVNSLAPHETRASTEEVEPEFIPDSELQGSLKVVIPVPFRRTRHSLPNPSTPHELELRMHQALTFAPLPSLSRLLRYHDLFPSLHSAESHNFLIQLAIRHTSYSKAFQLLQRMEEAGIKPNTYSKLLYIRVLVRAGRWDDAWTYVRQELLFGDEKSALSLLLELLGYHAPAEFHKDTRSTSGEQRNGGYDDSLVRRWQNNILAVIPNYLPPDAHPPVHFIRTVVRHLLKNNRTKTARAITMEWICHLPKKLSLPLKRHCLCLLHLHLAFSSKTLEAYFANRKFVDSFLRQRPDVLPNSTTLFLLLRSLTRAKGRLTHHAIGLLRAFRKQWGSIMIDRRVRRRIVDIALQEGRLGLAQRWMEVEDRASRPRKLMALQGMVVGEQAVKLPQKIRRMPFQKLMPGVDDENRKWRWLKRRLWKRKRSRLSRQTQSSMFTMESEKDVVDRPGVDVESRTSG